MTNTNSNTLYIVERKFLKVLLFIFCFPFIQGETGGRGLPGLAGMRGADVRLLYL